MGTCGGALALVAALLTLGTTFLPGAPGASSAPARQAQAAATGLLSAALLAEPPAIAGEPPSVGEHWYWNLGIGSLHGETASIILLVFALLVCFSLLGAGGSSKKTAA